MTVAYPFWLIAKISDIIKKLDSCNIADRCTLHTFMKWIEIKFPCRIAEVRTESLILWMVISTLSRV